MAATAETARSSAFERSWWLRAPAVLVAPRAVFVSLRDDSEEAVEARQEPITAIAALAGIAGVLATPVARTLLNDGSISVSVIPVWAFFGGMVYAVAVYWLGGGLLFGAARRFGSLGSYRRARHLLVLSATPIALTLFTVWPIRIAIYGENLFRTGRQRLGAGRPGLRLDPLPRVRLERRAARDRRPQRARVELGPLAGDRGAGGGATGSTRALDSPRVDLGRLSPPRRQPVPLRPSRTCGARPGKRRFGLPRRIATAPRRSRRRARRSA